MSEMKEINETPKSRKPLFIGVGVAAALIAALVSGGIAVNANDDTTPDAAPSVTATATASPSATAIAAPTSPEAVAYDSLTKEEKEEADKLRESFAANPLGVKDVKAMLAKADPQIGANYNMTKEQVDAAILQTLNTYTELYAIDNVRGERMNEPADSALIGSQFSEKIAGSYLPTLKAQMDKQAPFPTVNRDGSIGVINGVKYFPKATPSAGEAVWMTSFSDNPAITYTSVNTSNPTDPTHGINIKGERYDIILAEGGGAVESRCTFSVTSVPAADNKWLVTGIGCSEQTVSVLSQGELDKKIADAREGTNAQN